jgi:hypothetical protein
MVQMIQYMVLGSIKFESVSLFTIILEEEEEEAVSILSKYFKSKKKYIKIQKIYYGKRIF